MSFEACENIATLLQHFDKPWYIAGGWAIDLYIGRQTRVHKDIEVAVLREDQQDVRAYLNDWSFQKVVRGQLQPWEQEFLTLPIHEIHATHTVTGEQLEILLNDVTHEQWTFRRDTRISLPLSFLRYTTSTGIPYLAPEVVLLYKATQTREKDDADFTAVKPLLEENRKQWLREALTLHVPTHHWIPALQNEGEG